MAGHGWQYACRTAKNIQIWYAGAWQALETIGVCRGRKKMWRQVGFTETGYGPVQVIGW